ncbi:hypothetical protein HW49_00160 [Porphyromonadaceae bacterium COT-184 OH4590]|nr:hypothetical protein HW49_00160 [Porphyromonadaceae bacterium COT-184 OH4590]
MKRIALFVVTSLLIVGCGQKNGRKADISGIDMNIKIARFDQDLLALKESKNLKDDLDKLFDKYPTFAPIYFGGVVYFGNNKDTILSILPKFFADSIANKLYTDALKKWSDISKVEKQLTEAIKRGKYFFPQITVPQTIMCVSLINQSMIVADSIIAIGIDKYLGANYPLYAENSDNYSYLIQNWTPEKLVSDYVSVWLLTEFPYQTQQERLIDEMIYKGKILYLTSLLLPNEKPNLIMGYSEEQWKWCRDNEKAMWQTLIAEQHLFSSDYTLVIKYLNESPFTQPFTQESPGRAGQYVGWQIVNAYMSKNENITPQELMSNPNGQMILEQSGYNP